MYKTLKNIEIAYLFARQMNHGINSSQYSNWQLFEPSKFIYAYFSFNMLYDIDLDRSIDKDRIVIHPGDFKTGKRILFLTNFIHKNLDAIYEKMSAVNYDRIIKNSKDIRRDRTIDKKDIYLSPRYSFFENYKIAIKGLEKKALSQDNHYRLLSFCNQIRNNIFHGAKTISHMQIQEQRNRLVDYTKIILQTMELTFEIIEQDSDYFRAGSYDLDENIMNY